ncbi:Deoxyribodipyrimidine photo-lyase-related protein [Roseivivax jejudonensis]|uniref:Deoxyribodipyrimidine photo-lyase-related protein n=1 Tax=Roseivivax jejudonensis TaxID=1529041 RepID=A0A1X6ZSY8_9RHOB|nr:cryptochrome/photolyase family protein [Roseivivax jejudonensis]SLN60205.1 Deoxyribodipyrimidine photo-lyase-related protein [Roseivivax jejudonensis]
MSRLVLVLGDQLSPELSALRAADKDRDVVVMAEVAEEANYVQHHPKKIALIFAAMRKFAVRLRSEGWDVRYAELDDTDNAGSIPGELLRRAEETGAREVIATEPGEWRLIEALSDMPLRCTQHADDRFIASHEEFERWAKGRKTLRMEYFYREQRKKTGYLMEGDAPAGGQWNFDHDNRKPAPDDIAFGGPMQFTPDAEVEAVLELVEARFGNWFGDVRPFWYATDQAQARRALTHFVKHALPSFGDYQDAMVDDEKFLYHGVISAYINLGLLDPREVCDAVETAWREGAAPLNAVEGFIRQVIGWREYMRGIYFHEGPDYPRRNGLNHQRGLPPLYWGAETKMRCLSKVVAQTREEAYAHHIQRLMVTGNFALLCGIDPAEVEDWYMRVYVDAYEWVTAPNTIGMSQFADGGVIASKPYVSSGSYIDRMSDYCGSCHYAVKTKTGEGACPFNLLYWHFMDRHRDRFEKNPRMAQMYATWDRMKPDRRETVIAEAEAFLDRLSKGETV